MFFLSTAGEYSGLTEPRSYSLLALINGYNRDDYMLVQINPPLIDPRLNLLETEIEFLILSSVLKEQNLFQNHDWPVGIYVAAPKNGAILKTHKFEFGEVEGLAKGFIFNTFEDATAAANVKF